MERRTDWFLSTQAVPPSRVLSPVVTSGARRRGAAGAVLPGPWHRRSRLMLGTMCVIALCLQVLSWPAQAQVVRAFTPRFSTNDNGDILMIGNTLLSCQTSDDDCTDGRAGTGRKLNNDDYSMVNVNVAGGTTNSSSADLLLPPGASVLWAGLYWGARSTNSARNQVRFATPHSGYELKTATTLDVSPITSPRIAYQSFVEVTAEVQAGGPGTYKVADIQADQGTTTKNIDGNFAGWALVVVFQSPTEPLRNLTVFDGYAFVTTGGGGVTTTVSGFVTPLNGPFTTHMGAVVYDGDLGRSGDEFKLNNNMQSDDANPNNNFFNSSITRLGVPLTTKNPNFVNQLGVDIDLVDVSGSLDNGATSATLTFLPNPDGYFPGVLIFATGVFEPVVNVSKAVVDLNGGDVMAGDELAYTLVLTNTGNDTAVDLVLTDPIPFNATYVPDSLEILEPGGAFVEPTDDVGDDEAEFTDFSVIFRLGEGANASTGGQLSPGASTTLRFRVRILPEAMAGTLISNQATTTYSGAMLATALTARSDGDPATPGEQPTDVVVGAAQAELSVLKSDTPDPVVAGQNITYTLTMTNGGPSNAQEVTLTDVIPANTTFQDALAPEGWRIDKPAVGGTGTVTFSHPRLPPGTAILTLVVQVTPGTPDGTSISNTATVTSPTDPTPPPSASTTTTVIGGQDISISKSTVSVTGQGQDVPYTLIVTNPGPDDASVTVTDEVPSQTTFGSATAPAGWSVTEPAVGGTGQVIFAHSSLPPGTHTLTLVVRVDPGVSVGTTISNTATITVVSPTDPNEANNTATATTRLIGPMVTKSFSPSGVLPGGRSTLTIVLTNPNAVALTGAAITDTYPEGITNADPPATGTTCGGTVTATVGGGSVSLTNGTVPANDSCTVSVLVRVSQSTPPGSLVNTIAAGDLETDGGSNLLPVSATLNVGENITVEKAFDSPTIAAGETSVLIITLTNPNPLAIEGTTVIDNYPPGMVNAGTPAATTTCPGGSVTALPGAPTVRLAGGTIPDDGSCTIRVTVTAAGGTYTNTIPVGDVQTDNGGSNTTEARATLDVALSPPSIVKSFTPANIPLNGITSLRLMFANANTSALTGVAVNDTFPAGMSVAAPLTFDTSGCGTPTFAPAVDDTRLTFSDGTIAAGSTCTITVNVTSTTLGEAVNTTGRVTSQNGGTGDTATATLSVTAPNLRLTKAAPLSTRPGEVLPYALTVRNAGNRNATGVLLTETVPDNTTFNAAESEPTSWSCADGSPAGTSCTLDLETLSVDESSSATFAVTVVTPFPAGVTTVTNTATVADADDSTSDTATAETGVTATSDLQLTKTGSGDPTPGGVVVYTLIATNIGSQDATGVVLTDTLPDNTTFNAGQSDDAWECMPATRLCTFPVGTLAGSGDPRTVTLAVTVATPLPAGVDRLINIARVADDGSNGPDPVPANNVALVPTPITATPDLQLTKDDGDATATPGEIVAYTLTATNTGNQDATGVVLTDTIPDNTTFNAGASTLGWECAPNTAAPSICTFPVGDLGGGGAERTVTFAVTVATAFPAGDETLSNTARVFDDGTNGDDPTPANNTATDVNNVNAPVDLELLKDDGGATTTPGGVVTYALTVNNVSDREATGVVLSETVPEHTTFARAASTAGWSCANGSPAGSTCTISVASLPAGSTRSAIFAVRVITPLPAGITEVTNTADVREDGASGPELTLANNTASDETDVTTTPTLAATKRDEHIDTDGSGDVNAGDTLHYIVEVRNPGDVEVLEVEFADDPGDNTTLVVGSVTRTQGTVETGNTTGDTTVLVALGSLSGGATATIEFDVEVITPLPPTVTQIANQGGVAGIDVPGVPTDDPDTLLGPDPTITLLGEQPLLMAVKSDTPPGGSTAVSAGDTLSYTVILKNEGTGDATGVVFTDTPGLGTSLIVESVESPPGTTVEQGNNPGDTTVEVNIGTLAPEDSVTITFAVLVDDPLPDGLTEIDNQGEVTAVEVTGDVLTDDPDLPGLEDPTVTPIQGEIILTAVKSDLLLVDADGDGQPSPGDRLEYLVTIANAGDGTAIAVRFTDTPDPNSTLVVGSVVRQQGTVLVGNRTGDSHVDVDIGTLEAGARTAVRFGVVIANPLAAGVEQLANQGEVTAAGQQEEVLTDDPDTPAASDPTVTPLAGAPDLQVRKDDGTATVSPGGVLTYTLTYTNAGNEAASGAVLIETVPANTTFAAAANPDDWDCVPNGNAGSRCTLALGTLAVGDSGSGTATFVVTVAAPVPAGVQAIENTVRIDDDGTSGLDLNAEDNTATIRTPLAPLATHPDLRLAKNASSNSVVAGAPLVYTLTITNVGGQDATGVTLTDTVPEHTTFNAAASTPGWDCVPDANGVSVCTLAVGTLAGGGATSEATFAVTVATPLPAGVPEITNTAIVADDGANGPDLTPRDNTATETTAVDAAPDLQLTKSEGGGPAAPGETVSYTLTLTNGGTQGATGIIGTETVPAHTTFNAGASTPGWSCADGSPAGTECTIMVGSLPGGASVSGIFAVTVDTPLPARVEQLTNTASVIDNGNNGPDPGDNTATDTTEVDAAPDLRLDKSDNGTATPGATVAYTLTVTNDGPQEATGVVLTERVPPNTTFAPGESTAGWACVPDNTAESDCTLTLGALAGNGATHEATFAVSVVNPLPTGVTQITNIASVADDGHNGPDPTRANNRASDTTPVTATPDLRLTKDDGGASVAPGATVPYTLRVTNMGTQEATGVVLTETVPQYSMFNAGASTSGWSCVPDRNVGSTCTLTLSAVAGGGGSQTATFAVTVVAPVPAGVEAIANTASVTDDSENGQDPIPTNNTASDTTPVTATPDLQLTKDDGVEAVAPGDPLVYTLMFTNVGVQDAAEVSLQETVPEHTTFDADASTPGWTCLPNTSAGSTCSLPIGGVAAGASGSRKFAVTVLSPLLADVTAITNTARFDAATNAADPTPDDNTDTIDTPIRTTPGSAVRKRDTLTPEGDADNSGNVTSGDTLTYTVEVENIGDVEVREVVFTDAPDPNTTLVVGSVEPRQLVEIGNNPGDTLVSVAIGTLPAGETVTITFDVLVNRDLPPEVVQLANQGVASGAGVPGVRSDDPDTREAADPTVTPVGNVPVLHALKVDALEEDLDESGGVTTGDTLLYRVTLQNTGTTTATGVVFTDPPSDNVTLEAGTVEIIAGDGNIVSGNGTDDTTVTVDVGRLAPDATVRIAFQVRVNDRLIPEDVTFLSNQGRVAATEVPDGVLSDDPDTPALRDPTTTPLQDTVELRAIKTDTRLTDEDGDGSASPGERVRYTITLSNTGTADATGVQFTDTPDANSTLEVGSVETAVGMVTRGNNQGDTDVAVDIGTLPGESMVTLHFDVRVNSPLPAGIDLLANQGVLTADGRLEVLTDDPTTETLADATETPVTGAPDLRLEKTATGAVGRPGSTLVYTLTYSNVGTQDATGVVLTETIPADTTFEAGASDPGWLCTPDTTAGSDCRLTVGAVAADGSTAAVPFAVTVDSPLPANVTQITNLASVADDELNGEDLTPEDNEARTTTPITATPMLTALKDDALQTDADGSGSGNVTPGDTLRYTVAVRNTGAVEVRNVIFTDTPGTNTTLVAGSVNPSQGIVTMGNTPGDTTVAVEIGSLPGQENILITFDVLVNQPLPLTVTQVANQGLVAGDGVPGVLSDDPETLAVSDPTVTPLRTVPLLEAFKTAVLASDEDSDGVTPGDTLRYTVILGNAGRGDATNVRFTDTPGAGTRLVVGSVESTVGDITRGNITGDTSVAVTLGPMAPSATATISFLVTITSALPTVSNQGFVTAADQPQEPTDDPATPAEDDPTVTPLQDIVRLVATKADVVLGDTEGDGQANPGGTVRYLVTLTNTGTAAATGVFFTDTPGANSTLIPGSVVTSQGTVTAGNATGATAVAVAIGTVAGQTSVTVQFDVRVANPLAAGVRFLRNQGTVTATNHSPVNTDDPATTDPGDPTDTPLGGAPDLRLGKTDGGVVGTPGAPLVYTLSFTNVGTREATDVVLTDGVPANTTFTPAGNTAGWNCQPNRQAGSTCTLAIGTVAGGGSGSATFTVTLAQPVPSEVVQITNQARIASSNEPDATLADNTATDTTPVQAAPDLRLTKDDGGVTITPGDTLTYTLNFTNAGPQAATGVVLTETVPAHTTFVSRSSTPGWACIPDGNAGRTCTLTRGTLAVGAEGSATFVVAVADSLPADVTQIINTATIASDERNGLDPNPADNTATTATPVLVLPTLALTKTDNTDIVAPGETLTYTVRVTNPGTIDVQDVVFTDTPGDNTTLVVDTVTTTQGTVTMGNTAGDTRVTVDIGTVSPGQTVDVEFAVAVDDALPLEVIEVANQGMVVGTGVTGVPSDDPETPQVSDPTRTPLRRQPQVEAFKTAEPSAGVMPGETLLYTVTLTNVGTAEATDVVFTDTPGDGLMLVFGSVDSTAGAIISGNDTGDTSVEVDVGTIAPGAGATVTITFAVQVADPLPPEVTFLSNQGLATSADNPEGEPTDNPATPSDDDPTDTPLQGTVVLTALKTDLGDGQASPGDTLRYLVTLRNTGTAAATGVRFTDTPDDNSTLVAGSVRSEGSVTTGNIDGDTTVVVDLGTLAGGAEATVRFDVLINATLPAGVEQLENQGILTAVEVPEEVLTDDPDTGAAADPTVTPLAAAPDLQVTKDDNDATATPGATLVYTLGVSNAGTQDATGVELTETVPDHTTFVETASTPGWQCTPDTTAESTCKLLVGDVAAGTSETATFAVTVVTPLPATVGQIANTVSIADDDNNGEDPTPEDNTADIITPVPGSLGVSSATKADALTTDADGTGTVTSGDTLTYTIDISNLSDVDIDNVLFTDTPDANTVLVGQITTTQGTIDTDIPAGDTTVVVRLGTLRGGTTATVTFNVTVRAALPPDLTHLVNQGLVVGDGIAGVLTDDPDTLRVDDPTLTPLGTPQEGSGLEALKDDALDVDADATGGVTAGDTLRYTIALRNAGAVPATEVVFSDAPGAGTTLLAGPGLVSSTAGTVTQGNRVGDTSVEVRLGTMVPGATAVVSFAVRVDKPLPPGTTLLSNQGLLTTAENQAGERTDDPTTPENNDPTLTPLQGVAALDSVKTDVLLIDQDRDGRTGPGDTLRYIVTLQNSGTDAATGVTFTDTPDDNSTLEVGSVVTSQGTVTMGNDTGDTRVAVALGTLNAETSATVRFDVVVATPLAAGVEQLANRGLVTADEQRDMPTDDPETPDPDDATVTPLAGAPDLILTKRAGGARTTPGALIVYTLNFRNDGTQDATGVTITETVPDNTTFNAAATPDDWSCADGSPAGTRCTLPVGALEVNASSSATFAVDVVTPLPAEATEIVNTASINDGSDEPDTNPEDNGDQTITPVRPTPVLLVTKLDTLTIDADRSLDVTSGDTLTYTIEIRNTGDVTLHDVVFVDAPDPNTTLMVGSVTTSQGIVPRGNDAGHSTVEVNVGDLPGGATVLLSFAVVINPSLPPDVTQVANQGLATTAELPGVLSDDPATPEVSDPTRTPLGTAPLLEAIKNDQLEEDADATGGVTRNDTLLYFVTLRNIGLEAATDVVFTDTPGMGTTLVPETVTTTAGTVIQGNSAGDTTVAVDVGMVEAGASVTISFMVQVNPQLPPGLTVLQNQGLVAWEDAAGESASEPTDDPSTLTDDDATTTPIQGTMGLAAAKLDILLNDDNGDGRAGPGDTVRYIVALRNTGADTATGVRFTDTPGAHSTLVEGSVVATTGNVTSGNDPGDSTVEVEVGTLEAGALSTLRFDVTVNDPLPGGISQIQNQGDLIATDQSGVRTDDPLTADMPEDPTVTPLQAAPDLQMAKEADNAPAVPGEVLLYTLRVTNVGKQDATDVTLMENVPPYTTFDAENSDNRWICRPDIQADSECTLVLDTLAAGASEPVKFAVTVSPTLPADATEIANTASVTDDDPNEPDPNPEDNTDSSTTPVAAPPRLTLTKTDVFRLDPDGLGAGDTFTYMVEVRNPGAVDVVNVVFTDAPDANTTLDVGTVTTTQGRVITGNRLGDSTVTVDIGDLPARESVMVTFAVVINTPLPSTVTQVANQGLVTGVGVPGVLSDDPDTPQIADPTLTPLGLQPVLNTVKRDALQLDPGSDGASAGDRLRYTVTITNTGTAAATDVRFMDTPSDGITLVAETVTSSRGPDTIVSGNTRGDTMVTVEVGTVRPGAEVIIKYSVQIDANLPPQVTTVTNQGLITSAEDPDGQPTDDPDTPATDDSTVTPIEGRPRLESVKTAVLQRDADGDGLAGPEDTIQYVITTTNVGTAPATDVRLTDTPDANTTLVVGTAGASQGTVTRGNIPGDTDVALTVDSLGAADSVTLSFQVTIKTSLPADVDRVSNQGLVRATGTNLVRTDDPTTPREDDPTVTPLARPELQGRVSGRVFHDRNGDGVLQPDEPGLPDITIRLTDSQGQTQTVLTDAAGQYVVTVPVGETMLAVDETTVPEGFVLTTNNAAQTVTVTSGEETATDPVGYGPGVPVTPTADLAILKTGPARIDPGETLTYTLTVRNAGPDAAVDLVITDPTPEGLTFLSAEAPCRAGFPCTIPGLAVGDSRTFTVSFRVPSDYTGPDPLRNTAAVANAIADPDPSNNSVTTSTAVGRPAQADLSLEKTGPPSAARGSTVTYTLTVTNAGPDDARAVVLNDRTPPGLEFVTATPPCTAGFPCELGTIHAEASVTVQVTFAVPADYAGPEPISNTASMDSPTTDPIPGNNTADTTTDLGADTVDLTLTKTGPPVVTAGENLTYTLVVTNNGPATATEVMLDDQAPEPLVFASASAPCQAGFPCALGALRASESRTVTVTFTVPPASTGPNPIINMAIVTATEPERDPSNNSATAVTGIGAEAADLQFTKSGPTLVMAGERLTYTLVVTNAGPGTATNVVLDDPTPDPLELVAISAPCAAGFPCDLGDLAAGSAVALTVTFRVPDPYTGPNPLTNTATADSDAPDPDPDTNTGTAETFVNVIPTGACLFQYRSLIAPAPGAPGDGPGGQGPDGPDDPVDEGDTSQTTPTGPVLRLITPQENDVVTGTALAVAVAQAPVRTLTVSQLRSVTVANGAPPAQLDIRERTGIKTERLTAGQAQVVITADRVVLELPENALQTNDILEVATVETAAAPGLLPGEVVGNLIALQLASGQETFQRPVTLRLPYADADHDGLVDGTSPAIDVTALTLWFFDATTEEWVQAPDALVLPDVNSVTAPLTAVTVVGLFLADDGSQGQIGVDDAATRPVRAGNGNTGRGWQTIGRTTSVPLVVAWNTTGLANGPYELRAVCAATPDALIVPTPPPPGADTPPRGQGGGDSGCFIATAAFGSPLAPQVQVLRAFRDRYLLPTAVGRWLVQRYYELSPALADTIRDRAALRGIVRVGLTPVVWSVWMVMHGTSAHAFVLLGLILLAGAGVGWRVSRRRWQR